VVELIAKFPRRLLLPGPQLAPFQDHVFCVFFAVDLQGTEAQLAQPHRIPSLLSAMAYPGQKFIIDVTAKIKRPFILIGRS